MRFHRQPPVFSLWVHRCLAVVLFSVFCNVACQAQDVRVRIVDPRPRRSLPIVAEPIESHETLPEPTYQRIHSVRDITIALAATDGDLPGDLSVDLFESSQFDAQSSRAWTASGYEWEAPKTCHNPLYFEQVWVERYGQTISPCFQPVLSAGHFYGDLMTLPVRMTLECPSSCRYGLGYYRPGSPTSCPRPYAQ